MRDTPFQTLDEMSEYFGHDKIECLLCGELFNQLTYRHLSKHSITAREYKLKFGLPLTKGLCGFSTSQSKSIPKLSNRIPRTKDSHINPREYRPVQPFQIEQIKRCVKVRVDRIRANPYCKKGHLLEYQKDGVHRLCKVCKKELANIYAKNNRPRVNKSQAKYSAANREKILAKAKEKYAANKQELRAKAKEKYAANRDMLKAKALARYHARKLVNTNLPPDSGIPSA